MLKKKLLYFIVFSVIFFLPHSLLLPNFIYSIPIFLLVFLALRFEKEKLADLGLRLKNISLKSIGIGLAAGITAFAILQLAFWPLIEYFYTFDEIELGLYDFLRQSLGDYIFLVIMGYIIGGFYEETIFHGYIFTRLEKVIESKYSLVLSLLITNIIFALYHIQMGPIGVTNAFLGGVMYNYLSLHFNRNLWISVICHGTYNALVLSFIYYDFF